MDERFQDVCKAAEETFKWIFEDPDLVTSKNPELRIPFLEWLESGSGIFHISGKPGSGKSTLMKFLCQHIATTDALLLWAGNKTLVFARFFFRNQGKRLQRSIIGLV